MNHGLVNPPVPSPFKGVRSQFIAILCATLAGVAIAVGGCSFGDDHTGPGGRSQRRALPPEQEEELGRQANDQILEKAGRRLKNLTRVAGWSVWLLYAAFMVFMIMRLAGSYISALSGR